MAAGDYVTLKTREWERPLLRLVSGLLVFETATGLVIWLLPFSVPTQMTVLGHTVAGVVFTLPFLWYQLRHWKAHRSIRVSHVVLTGYFAMTAAVTLVVSGAVLTVQAVVGTRIGRAWDWVHIVATFALVGAVLPHVVTLIRRAARSGAEAGESRRLVWAGAQRFLRGTSYVALACVLAVAVATMAYRPPRLVNELPKDYSYVARVRSGGRGRRRAPGRAWRG